MDIVIIVLQVLLILMFLMAGIGKLSGSKMHVENFKKWGYPQWFRTVTGLIELVAAILLVIGFWSSLWLSIGALILVVTAVGGVITHIRAKDSFKNTFLILLLGVLALILFFII
jgi:putative oxidoreductase